ncbi:hypothetical protein GCM10009554_82920 [Kribbella koreensis]|uniref:Uncharacterized protein n=1 Tax=Kribbella koreensis TaxID=57909 RepID=A0ABP4C9T8_9ACTN
MIRQLAALCATTALLAAALPATQSVATPAAAAEPTACAKTVLPLPADTEPGLSMVRSADPSGRYILGHAPRQERAGSQGVLWVDGVPRWLASKPDSESYGYAVVKGGFVLGYSSNQAGTDYWVYSVKTDSYRILQVPEGQEIYTLSGMNARQDIVGSVSDETDPNTTHAFIWPAGGQPRLLRTPRGSQGSSAEDISDEGRIIGRADNPEDPNSPISYLWESWNSRPIPLRGPHHENVFVWDIEGSRIGGQVGNGIYSTGYIWNTRGALVAQVEDAVADVNSSGDAVTAGDDFIDHYPSILVRSDGTRYTFPEGTMLTHAFNRNAPWTAGGYETNSGYWAAVVYKCGS